MQEFTIRLHSVQDVQDFVALSTTQGFPILVCDGHHRVNGGSFMEMFCLELAQPLTVSCQCTAEQFGAFQAAAEAFLAD